METASVPPPREVEESIIRQRKNVSRPSITSGSFTTTTTTTSTPDPGPNSASKETETRENEIEATYGKTPSGEIFKVPATVSFVTTLITTLHRSSLTRVTFASLISQPLIFWFLRGHPTLRSIFFLLYFTFWRGCYDFGFAWVLRKQSEKKWIVRTLKAKGWLDPLTSSAGGGSGSGIATTDEENEGKAWAAWWKRELEMKMGEGYKWESVPAEFNAWLMFRQLVDVVLLNDFVSYSLFAWSNLNFPPNHSIFTHAFRWIFGWSLIFFNLWVKMDAHRVVKDYAWYWGDAFWLMVMQNDLVFDGVYEIAPHPMYSVGYAGYYGLSMVVGSYTVLFVSLAAHAAQFAFLLWFENPHIERTYGGGKKPLASRVPLSWSHRRKDSVSTSVAGESGFSAISISATSPIPEDTPEAVTPPATEGDTETEPELPELPLQTGTDDAKVRKPRSDSTFSILSVTSDSTTHKEGVRAPGRNGFSRRTKSVSMHDLTHRFFRKPVVVLSRLDIFRAADFALVVLLMYSLSTLIPPLPPKLGLTMHFLHALSWRLFHSFGLGSLLQAQSRTKWLVRHYLKHYHYPSDDVNEGMKKEGVVKRATEEAFGNWQVGYNISLVMTYVSFANLAWKTYHLPLDWTVSGTILRHVLGALLIALHVWAAVSTYEVLGDFGWLYSDFFLIEQIPSQLAYTGIYRFLNNPERSMGGAAFLGLWLISNSKLVLVVAVVSHLSHWWFLSTVERPHMQRLYGDRLRVDGGLTKTLKSVAGKTLVSKAGRHAPEIQRVVREVQDSIEKVEEKVTLVIEELLDHARPRIAGMVHDTKTLLQQSRERMIFTRVADVSALNPADYSMTVATSSASPEPRYHVGQPIKVSWTAPAAHSRKDWIGIYRLGSCQSQLVTRISSLGKWAPIFEEEYDGDEPVDPQSGSRTSDSVKGGGDAGEVVLRGEQLPWSPGEYELRYHHDGKHNVMSRLGNVQIFASKPADQSFEAIHKSLVDIVCLSLDSNPALLPKSAKTSQFAQEATPAPLGPGTHSPSLQDFKAAADAGPEDLGEQVAAPVAEGEADADPDVDPDDFTIMDETQAKRIVSLCEMVFGVELSVDVIVADANVEAIARRVLGAQSLITGSDGGGGGGGISQVAG